MFVVPGQPARRHEREEHGRYRPDRVGPHTAAAPESGNSRTPNAQRHNPPRQGRRLPTITTLIPSTGRFSVATLQRGFLHASCPAQKAKLPGLRGSRLRLGAFPTRAGEHHHVLGKPSAPPRERERPMSSDAREWVWEHSSSRGTARLVLLSIADRVTDEQCVSWASLTSLAKRTRASVSTVREAISRLVDDGELEQLDDLTGPQRSTVYRLPLAAKAVAQAPREQQEDSHAASPDESEAALTLRISALRRCGIRPREVPESPARVRKPAVPETGRSRRKPAPRRTGNRHSDVPETGTQNRSEPDLNRRYSSGGAAVTSAAEWQVDPATHAWARQQGHLDRLGEEGLQAADAKWRAHRADFKPRTAASWAADWRSWVAREHAPGRPNLYAVPGQGPAQPGGMTRAEAHTAALLAALEEPTGTE